VSWTDKWWRPKVSEDHWCYVFFDQVTDIVVSSLGEGVPTKVGVNLFTLSLILQSSHRPPIKKKFTYPTLFLSPSGMLGIEITTPKGRTHQIMCGKSVSRFIYLFRTCSPEVTTTKFVDEVGLETLLRQIRKEYD